MRPHLADNRLVEAGRHGQKTSAGWYKYEKGNRTPMPDTEAEKIIAAAAKEGNIPQRKIGKEEIVERTIYGLINEGAQILDEGHALRSVDIDIVYIYGYGFPAFRGGPMFYADTIGLKKIYDRVCPFEKEQGFWWKPSPLLKRLAEAGQTFADFDRQKWGGGA
jgi:3-hydroxyacyl-CoA dehydrogenase